MSEFKEELKEQIKVIDEKIKELCCCEDNAVRNSDSASSAIIREKISVLKNERSDLVDIEKYGLGAWPRAERDAITAAADIEAFAIGAAIMREESTITTDADGNKLWHNEEGQLHREDGLPAIEYADGSKEWWVNDVKQDVPKSPWVDKYGNKYVDVPKQEPNLVGGNPAKPVEIVPYLSASEALFGFMTWLTTRVEAVTFSSRHDCAKAVELVGLFCKTNNLEDIKGKWHENFEMPKEPHLDEFNLGEEADNSFSVRRFNLIPILSLLSGDFNYDDVAKAKEALKQLIQEDDNN